MNSFCKKRSSKSQLNGKMSFTKSFVKCSKRYEYSYDKFRCNLDLV